VPWRSVRQTSPCRSQPYAYSGPGALVARHYGSGWQANGHNSTLFEVVVEQRRLQVYSIAMFLRLQQPGGEASSKLIPSILRRCKSCAQDFQSCTAAWTTILRWHGLFDLMLNNSPSEISNSNPDNSRPVPATPLVQGIVSYP